MDSKTEKTYKFVDGLRKIFPFYGFTENAIKSIFLKYMASFTDINEIEDFKRISEYKDLFIKQTLNKDVIKTACSIVEDKYGIKKDLLFYNFNDFCDTYKKNEKELFKVLNEFDLPQNNKDMQELLKFILNFTDNKDVTGTGFYISNRYLVSLVSKVLDVKENETFLDCCCGYYSSALDINAKTYLGFEAKEGIAGVANMIMVMLNKQGFTVEFNNFYEANIENKADKVFMDGPINQEIKIKLNTIEPTSKMEKSEICNIKYALKALNNKGTACVTTIQSILFRSDYTDLRKELVNHNLKAVIALPSMYLYMGIHTFLLVLEKECKNDRVIMIDAKDADNNSKSYRRDGYLSQETMENIMKSLNGEEIDGFSKTILRKQILKEENVVLMPTYYIKKKVEINYRSIDEINKELEETYKQINKLFNKKEQ